MKLKLVDEQCGIKFMLYIMMLYHREGGGGEQSVD